MKRFNYQYNSIFATEIQNYLKHRRLIGKYTDKTESVLKDFDAFLIKINHSEKSLTPELFIQWQKTRNVCSVTKAQDCSHVKSFCQYLTALNIKAICIDRPIIKSNYVPYVFSDEEIERIIYMADNCQIQRRLSRASTIFPILLRILYGCGLRLGEGLRLKWDNVDLINGILTIENAKNGKNRIIPMKSSLTEILKIYRSFCENKNICSYYLFESKKNKGNHMKNNTFYMWFSNILKSSNIYYFKENRTDRGPCGHCLRHTFTRKAFLNLTKTHGQIENIAPFLETYLGHNSIMETQAYLRSSYVFYTESHQRIAESVGDLFPEVIYDEE